MPCVKLEVFLQEFGSNLCYLV